MPIELEMNLTSSGKAIYVTLLEDFRLCPTQFFRSDNFGGFRHDPRQINVCDRSNGMPSVFPDSMGGILKVSTESELQSLTTRLLEKPIFFTVDIERNRKTLDSNVRYITKGQLAVTVNTQHPHIHQHLQAQLAQGMDAMQQGNNFAVEFDFNHILAAWMKSTYGNADNEGCTCPWDTHYTSENGKVTITNYSELSECFSCKYPWPVVWVVCLPFCLLTCPCYRIHRALIVKDFGGEVTGVEATYWSAARMRSMAESLSCALSQLVQQETATEAAEVEVPVSCDAVDRTHQPSGGPQTYGQPVSQQPGYRQPMIQETGHVQPIALQQGNALLMALQQGNVQPMVPQQGNAQPMVPQQGNYAQPMVPQQGNYAQPMVPQQGNYAQPMVPQQGNYAQPMVPQQGNYAQPMVPQQVNAQPMVQQPGYSQPMN